MALRHALPGEVVDLGPLGPGLAGMKSHAIIKSKEFEALRLTVRAGTKVPPHAVPGEVALYCIEGHVLVKADVVSDLRAGSWMYLAGGTPHSIEAIEDASLLVTIILSADIAAP